MKKKNTLFIILYMICTICFTISGLFPHVFIFETATEESLGPLPGPELLGALFFIIAVLLFLTSKLKPAFYVSLFTSIIMGFFFIVLYFVYGFMYVMTSYFQTYIIHPSLSTGLISYIFLFLLTILIPTVFEFKK